MHISLFIFLKHPFLYVNESTSEYTIYILTQILHNFKSSCWQVQNGEQI